MLNLRRVIHKKKEKKVQHGAAHHVGTHPHISWLYLTRRGLGDVLRGLQLNSDSVATRLPCENIAAWQVKAGNKGSRIATATRLANDWNNSEHIIHHTPSHFITT